MSDYKYYVGLITIAIMLLTSPLASAKKKTGNSGAKLDVEALVKEAVSNNPSLAAARYNHEAQSLRVNPAGALPDPTIILGLQAIPIDTFAFDELDMTQKVIGITQPLPYPGKLKLAQSVAKSDSVAAKRQVRMLENKLAFDVRRTFFEWAYQLEALKITEHNTKVISNFIEIATSKYAVGKSAQWDILRAHVEHTKLTERRVTITQKIESLKTLMANLVGRKQARVDGILQIDWTPTIKLEEKALVRRAEKSNPSLSYLRAKIEKSQNALELARRQRLPDFSVTFTYGQRSDGEMNGMPRERPDLISGMLGIRVPLYARNKQIPLAESAEMRLRSDRKNLEDVTLRLGSEIRDRVLRIRRADDVEKLYRTGILPQARITVESAMSSYRVNKVDFLTLLTSELTLMNYELDYYRVRIDRETDIAALTLLLGEPAISVSASTIGKGVSK